MLTPPQHVASGFWLSPYRSGVGHAIARSKTTGDRSLLAAVASGAAEAASPYARGRFFSSLVPAPSPWKRRVRRGFSPAAVLAAPLSRQARIPLVHALDVAHGVRQSALSAGERRDNLAGRIRARRVQGRVLLIDDVTTTGTTLSACADALLTAGADEVWALAICRALQGNGSHGMATPDP